MKNSTATLIAAAVISIAGPSSHADFSGLRILEATIDVSQPTEAIYSELSSSAKTVCEEMTQPGRDRARNVRICRKEVLADWVEQSRQERLAMYHNEQSQPRERLLQVGVVK